MLRVDCYDFYKLGLQIHPLSDLAHEALLNDVWISLFTAKSELLSFFNIFPLKTCQPPARALYQALTEVIPDDFAKLRLQDEDGSARKLTFAEANAIRISAAEFETVLKAELSGWDTFFVSQKGAYSTTDLINKAEALLPETALTFLDARSRDDLRQAGQSLAYNLGTAAAFHMVRATESYISKYYELVVGPLPPTKSRNWGAYFRSFERCGKADAKVLGWLSHVKDNYRNPVVHPDVSITPEDALEFVSACVALIAVISKKLAIDAENRQEE